MSFSKSQKISVIISMAIIAVALIFLIVEVASSLSLWVHPALNFVFILCLGFGLLTYSMAIKTKAPFMSLVGIVLLSLAVSYAVGNYIVWWATLLVSLAILAMLGIVGYVCISKNESIALNDNPNYKNYQERKAEKEALEAEKEPEVLPEIKSFK